MRPVIFGTNSAIRRGRQPQCRRTSRNENGRRGNRCYASACRWPTRQEQAGQSADAEEEDEHQRVAHGRASEIEPFVHRGQPIEDLDGRRDRHTECEHAENHAGQDRLPAGEHVVSPNQEAQKAMAMLL